MVQKVPENASYIGEILTENFLAEISCLDEISSCIVCGIPRKILDMHALRVNRQCCLLVFFLVVETVSVPTPPVAAFLCCASEVGFQSIVYTTKDNVLGFAVEGLGDSDRFVGQSV